MENLYTEMTGLTEVMKNTMKVMKASEDEYKLHGAKHNKSPSYNNS